MIFLEYKSRETMRYRRDIDRREFLTVVAQKLDALGEGIQQLAVNLSRDLDGIKCSVCDADAIQGAGLAFGNEFVSVGGLGLDHVCDVGDGLPCYVSAGREMIVSSI